MRIITGTARGRKLFALEGDKVRPTTDKVKESLFNILQFRVEGRRFLDLFAGSGQIGLEALSRGARHSTFVDTSKASIRIIEKNIAATGFEKSTTVIHSDFKTFLSSTGEMFDVVFIDPPFANGLIEPALEAVAGHLSPAGIIVCEHPRPLELPEELGGLKMLKSYRYGKIALTTYEKYKEKESDIS